MKLRLAFIALFFFLLVDVVSAQLKTGTWRGVLTTSTGNELPFNFEVETPAGKPQLAIINGAERLQVTDVKTVGDSVFIHMPLFNSDFKLKFNGSDLKGQWVKHLGDKDAPMAFSATPNTAYRFFKDSKSAANVDGRWSAMFGDGTPGKEKLVAEFKQTGLKVTGTFLSISGDYRYLEGTVNGDKLYLSCFDGGHAFIFTADVKNAQTLSDGKFYSGLTGMDKWRAVKDANAKLPDAYSLTALKPNYKKVAFKFKDLNGKEVSLTDARFKDKVIILQIMGSWCPNCMDETAFFTDGYYKKYHPKGVEIIGLAYERTTDFAKSKATVEQVKKRFNIEWPLLITGYTPAKGDPEKSLPMLANFKGFPSTIIIDRNGDVRKIHTGFSGPGTGEHFTEFKAEFEKLTDELVAEK